MICSNARCNKTIEQPLELYDGTWACPYCKERISNVFSQFVYTEENQEQYILGERYYFRYLTADEELRQKNGKKWLERAVDMCKKSARAGNPLAAIRLGYYYDKDYIELKRSEAMRCRVAYGYYASVAFCDGEPNNLAMVKDDWMEVKRRAARLMLQMILQAPESFSAVPRYSFSGNYQKVLSQLGDVGVQANGEQAPQKVKRYQQVFETFASCFSKNRAPLFGLLYLTGEEVKSLFEVKDDNGTDLYRMVEKGLDLRYIACDKNRAIERDDIFTALSNRRFITSCVYGDDGVGGMKNEGVYCLYFFNSGGKHRFFSKNERKKIQYRLENAECSHIKRLANDGGRADYTLFDDDVYAYKSKLNTLDGAVDKLINNVCAGE